MTLLATSIPGSSDNGYVAAAYIVFFAIVLIYVAIMAIRLSRVERDLRELNERTERTRQDETGQDATQRGAAHTQTRERETV
jgi:hypothetical protein